MLDVHEGQGHCGPPTASDRVAIDVALSPSIADGECPHLAVLLRTESELFPVLASFFALGAKRRGYLVHRAVPGHGDRDREQLAAAGLDVAGLEASKQLAIVELDPNEAPEASPQPWRRVLEESLSGGYSALWYARFAVGPSTAAYTSILPFEQAWAACFAGQPVVTLCPYVVGGLDGAEAIERVTAVSRTHEGVLLAGDDGLTLMRPALT